MRSLWTAFVVILGCGIYLFVSKLLTQKLDDESINYHRRPSTKNIDETIDLNDWLQFANGPFVDGVIVVKPKLLDSSNFRHRSKRSVNNFDNNEDLPSSSSSSMDDFYLYNINVLGRDVLLNLSRLNSDDNILAPNFIVQHFDTNYTYLENNINSTYNVDRCLYTGRIVDDITAPDPSTSNDKKNHRGGGSTLLNLCRGMYGVVELPQGTYFLEPLLNGTDPRPLPGDQPHHVLYKHQSHTFHDYQSSSHRHKTNHSLNQRKNISRSLRSSHANRYSFAHTGHQRRRRSYSWDYFVEVMVVADARLRRYHDKNLENYIVTLLSIVAAIYKHPSLEASLNVVLVRLIVLDHENAGPKISDNAQDTLKHFCRWQQSLNDADDESINHHDVAILLTRHDICRSPGKCDTLGLAELGTMCDPYRSCAIIEDNGLSAAFTIAHELGHIFNIPHDDEKKCSQFMALDKFNFHIMAPTLEYNTHPWSWSPCSSNMLKLYLENHEAYCLMDKPVQQKFSDAMVANPSPGLTFNVDQQCQFVFGPSASLCPYMPACKRLWCATAHGYQVGCRTQHMPWADGTPCGYSNRWCYRGECVGVAPNQLTLVEGGWGNWKEWGECSRSCGGGVKRARRDCDNPRPLNGGRYCVGERVRFRSCNTKECPHDTPEFRDVQCTEFNNDRRGIHGVPPNVRWVPQYSGINPSDHCKLYCAVENRADFYLMKHKVIDGTPCGRETDDICVDGQCKKAGCDGELDSPIKRDECGICGGDGTKCRKLHGTFNEPTTYGYNSVLKLQAGLNNIDIRQRAWNSRKDDDNYLALSNGQGEFILNGQFQVSVFHREVRVRGAILEYSGSDSVVERINSSKPLLEDLYLHVLAVGQLKPPDINWEFLVLDDPQAVAHRNEYMWKLSDQWTECSRPCHGSQTRRAVCVSNSDAEPKDERYCEGYRKPVMEQRVCNMHCQLKWLTEAASECSATCGAGEMNQNVLCVQTTSNHQQRIDDIYCRDLERPSDRVPCFNDCAGRRWVYTDWETCSKTCDAGVQRRSARCADQNGNTLDKRYCENLIAEPLEQICKAVLCPSWQYGEWSKCSATCGGGAQIRHASCIDAVNREIDTNFCNIEDRQVRRKCNEQLCTKWKFGGWSDCSKTCGDGISTREARCVDNHETIVSEDLCVATQKIVSKPCHLAPCPRWTLGDWSSCSRTCLDGWSTRRVQCKDSRDQEIDHKYCGSASDTPPSHKPCNLGPCPFWRAQSWSECSVSCGSGQKHRTVECVYKEEVVDSGYCRDLSEPPRHQLCTLITCPDWESGQWDQCSATCGDGYQRRIVLCVYPESRHTAEPELCNTEKKPKSIKECKKSNCPLPTTTTSRLITTTSTPSTSTTTTMTPSTTKLTTPSTITKRITPTRHSPTTSSTSRSITSFTTRNTAVEPLHEDISTASARYTANKLTSNQNSAAQTSPTKWEMGAWSECSVSCGYGEKMRYVACRDIFSRILPDIYCGHVTKPHDHERCHVVVCGEWKVGDWKQCTATCGDGHKRHRKVSCTSPNSDTNFDLSLCDSLKRPESEQTCHLLPCPSQNEIHKSDLMQSTWRVGEWGQCSASCGYGWQQRLVICLSPSSLGMPVNTFVECSESSKPESVRICQDQECQQWSIGEWGEVSGICVSCSCNKSCGGGYQRRMVECVQVETGQVLPTQNCLHPPPKPSQPCNIQRCQRLIWRTGKWSAPEDATTKAGFAFGKGALDHAQPCFRIRQMELEVHRERKKIGSRKCSATCGRGIRTRTLDCIDEETGEIHNNESECQSGAEEPKPDSYHRCRMARCPRWNREKWSPCSVSCGEGVRTRHVYCSEGRRNVVTDDKCLILPKPQDSARCHMSSCPFYHWAVTEWTKCSHECGTGKQTRDLSCLNNFGQRSPPSQCNSLKKPLTIQNCTSDHCPYVWVPGSWSTCSKSCGDGEQFRSLHCQMKNDPSLQQATDYNNEGGPQVPAYLCSGLSKPIVTRHCSLGSCGAEVFWQTDLWSSCSVTCGWGVQERNIHCVDKSENRLDRTICNHDSRPRRRRRCFLRNCEASDCAEVRVVLNTTKDDTYNVLVSGHIVKIYCHGMNGTLPKEYLSLSSGPITNYAEFYGKRLLFPFTCPYNGNRNESCPCTEEGNPKPGLTRFHKIRVDLQNMKINIMDSQFAVAERGDFVPYATAGDCYSAVDCPQGRFSVDLQGTGFRVSEKTVWQEDGHRTAKHVVRMKDGLTVQGNCGGYCGKCYPDKRHGLGFELDPWQFNEVQ